MNSISFSQLIKVVKPNYVYIKLTPHYSIRNNTSYRLAKTINSLYRSLAHRIRKDKAMVVATPFRQFLVGTGYSYSSPSKTAYFIYMEHNKAEFYLIVPEQYLNVIRERINDTWTNITVTLVDEIPTFSSQATKYQLSYAKEDALSLAVDHRTNELLESNLSIVDVLEEGDRVGIFYNFMPTNQFTWRSTYQSTILKIRRDIPVNRNKMSVGYLLRMALVMVSDLFEDIASLFSSPSHFLKVDSNTASFERALENFASARKVSDNTIKKGSDEIIDTQMLILSESPERLREHNNARSLAQSFDSISEDNNLVALSHRSSFNPLVFRISGAEINKVGSRECGNLLSLPGRDLLERYRFIDTVQTHETEVPTDLRDGVICLGTSTLKGHNQKAFLSTDFDYRMLSLVLIGPNRAGKSKFLANVARDAIQAGECVIIPDFIGSCQLSQEIAEVFPPDKVLTIRCDDPDTMQGMGYNEVPLSPIPFVQYKNAKEQAALLMTLVDSINSEDANFTAKMGRYMESAALVVFLSGGSINDVFNVLMNHKTRRSFIKAVPESQKETMEEYIDYLYELDNYERGELVGTKTHLITGAIDRLHRLKVNAYLEMMLKRGIEGNVDLVKEIQKSQLIVIRMPQRMFLTDNEKDVYTTYWMTKLWLALQIREEQIGDRAQMTKVNLIIDELYQVENAERFLTRKLSQLPKFNLKPIISCHYLNQIKIIREELRSANASYMLISGCDKKNYNELASELHPYQEEDLLGLPRYHSLNLIKCDEGYGTFITLLPAPIK